MQGHATTMGLICKVGPLPDASYFYFSMLDVDVDYDDGDGVQTYIARTGMQMTAFVSSSDLGVDNAEADTLPPVAGFATEGITTAQIQSGALDKVPYVVYCVNYRDTSMGHFIWSGGTIGEVRIKGTALINLEQRSLSNQLKQIIGNVDSTTCRAMRLGTMPRGTGGGVIEDWYPCGYDVSVEVIADVVVTAVDGTDPDLIFTAAGLAQDDNYFAPGSIVVKTGANIGIEREIASFAAGVITLSYPLPHPMEVAAEFDIQRECTKHWTGHNSCETFHAADKPLHFQGEPHIPVADAQGNLISGAA